MAVILITISVAKNAKMRWSKIYTTETKKMYNEYC